MRQVVDTIVWLGMIVVVAAVIYFTPRLANYVAASTETANAEARAAHRGLPAYSE